MRETELSRERLHQGVVIVAETSVDLTGSSRTEVALQNCPELRQGGWVFDPTHRPVMGCGLTQRGHTSLGEIAPLERRMVIPREGTVSHQQPTFQTTLGVSALVLQGGFGWHTPASNTHLAWVLESAKWKSSLTPPLFPVPPGMQALHKYCWINNNEHARPNWNRDESIMLLFSLQSTIPFREITFRAVRYCLNCTDLLWIRKERMTWLNYLGEKLKLKHYCTAYNKIKFKWLELSISELNP